LLNCLMYSRCISSGVQLAKLFLRSFFRSSNVIRLFVNIYREVESLCLSGFHSVAPSVVRDTIGIGIGIRIAVFWTTLTMTTKERGTGVAEILIRIDKTAD
jgi:hypothetical protein